MSHVHVPQMVRSYSALLLYHLVDSMKNWTCRHLMLHLPNRLKCICCTMIRGGGRVVCTRTASQPRRFREWYPKNELTSCSDLSIMGAIASLDCLKGVAWYLYGFFALNTCSFHVCIHLSQEINTHTIYK